MPSAIGGEIVIMPDSLATQQLMVGRHGVRAESQDATHLPITHPPHPAFIHASIHPSITPPTLNRPTQVCHYGPRGAPGQQVRAGEGGSGEGGGAGQGLFSHR